MKRRFTHKENSFHHCWERAKERYGIMLSEQDYIKMCTRAKMTISSKDKGLKDYYCISHRKQKAIILFKHLNIWIIGVYNQKIERFSTFLPQDTFNDPKYYKTCTSSTISLLKIKGLILSDEEWLVEYNKRRV